MPRLSTPIIRQLTEVEAQSVAIPWGFPADTSAEYASMSAMATPRSQLVHPTIPMFYHLSMRVVRQTYLLGYDALTGRNYDHRKKWLIRRIHHLAQSFAVAVQGYAIMDNHYHLVVFYEPLAPLDWSDEEVARRWCRITPPKSRGGKDAEALMTLKVEEMLKQPERIARCRTYLGDLSRFMYHLNHPLACMANKEDGKSGSFFEDRFYSGALLDEDAVLTCMAYVDLNPVRARIVRTIEDYKETSIFERLEQLRLTPERLKKYLAPLASGIVSQSPLTRRRKDGDACIAMTLEAYIAMLDKMTDENHRGKQTRWRARVRHLAKRQHAYGSQEALDRWAIIGGFKSPRWKALPAIS